MGNGLAHIERNLCEGNQAAGIYVLGMPHVTLDHNTCRANTRHGLALEASYITVTANSLISNTLAGLRVYDMNPLINKPITGVVAHGNTVLGNGTYGLYSGDAQHPLNATGELVGHQLTR